MQPSLSVPGGQNATPNAALTFASAGSNAVTVGDSAAGVTLTVALSDSYGLLNLPTTSELTITAGDNTAARTTVTGTASAINAALDGLTYTSSSSSSDTINLSVDDPA